MLQNPAETFPKTPTAWPVEYPNTSDYQAECVARPAGHIFGLTQPAIVTSALFINDTRHVAKGSKLYAQARALDAIIDAQIASEDIAAQAVVWPKTIMQHVVQRAVFGLISVLRL